MLNRYGKLTPVGKIRTMKGETFFLFLTITGFNLSGCRGAPIKTIATLRPSSTPAADIFRCPDKPVNPAHTPYTRHEIDGRVVFKHTPYQYQTRKGVEFRFTGDPAIIGEIDATGRKGIFCETDFEVVPQEPIYDEDEEPVFIPTYELMGEFNEIKR